MLWDGWPDGGGSLPNGLLGVHLDSFHGRLGLKFRSAIYLIDGSVIIKVCMMKRVLIQRMCMTRTSRRLNHIQKKLDQATQTAEEAPKLNAQVEERIQKRVPGEDPEADKELGKQLKYEDDVDKLM